MLSAAYVLARCLSVHHKSVFCRWMDWAVFLVYWLSFRYEFRYLQKQEYFSLEPSSGLWTWPVFCFFTAAVHVISCKCCELSLTVAYFMVPFVNIDIDIMVLCIVSGVSCSYKHIWWFWRLISGTDGRHCWWFFRKRRLDIFTNSTSLVWLCNTDLDDSVFMWHKFLT